MLFRSVAALRRLALALLTVSTIRAAAAVRSVGSANRICDDDGAPGARIDTCGRNNADVVGFRN